MPTWRDTATGLRPGRTPKSSCTRTSNTVRIAYVTSTACLPSLCTISARNECFWRATALVKSRCTMPSQTAPSCSAPRSRPCWLILDVGKVLDLRAFARYLTYEYVPSPSSIFRGIRKLPPAHWMTYDLRSGSAHLSRYWDLEFRPDRRRTARETAEEFDHHLRQAVQRRLVSDVPLGVLLSGGIDSSSVVALMADMVPARRIKTFNVAFADKSFDESRFARDVARRFGTEHHEQVFDVREMLAVLPEVFAFLDEPLADASLLPTYLLSRFTRRQVTVALGGDGGDELLAGYPTFAASRYAQWFEQTPGALQRLVHGAAARLPASTKNFSFDFKLRQFLKGMEYPEPRRTQVWLGSFSPSELADLLSEDVKAELNGFDVLEDLDMLMRAPAVSAADWLGRLIYQHANTYLADDILAKVDRASMACSLEVRAPFLDHTLAEFLGTVPSSFKLRGRQAKYLLKKSLAGKLPETVLHRRKKGFGIPIARWLKDELSMLARDRLAAERLRKQGIFNPQRVTSLLEEHQAGARNHRKLLWTLLVFQLWSEHAGL